MTVLIILFIISANILGVGFNLLKELYGVANNLMSANVKEKPPLCEIIYLVAGLILAVVGAILYYQVCAATIENIIIPHRPVDEPVPYGIGMILTSLIFTGGCTTALLIVEGKAGKIITATTITLLVTYLALKAQMILP